MVSDPENPHYESEAEKRLTVARKMIREWEYMYTFFSYSGFLVIYTHFRLKYGIQ